VSELDVKDVEDYAANDTMAATSHGVSGMGVAAAGSGNPKAGI